MVDEHAAAAGLLPTSTVMRVGLEGLVGASVMASARVGGVGCVGGVGAKVVGGVACVGCVANWRNESSQQWIEIDRPHRELRRRLTAAPAPTLHRCFSRFHDAAARGRHGGRRAGGGPAGRAVGVQRDRGARPGRRHLGGRHQEAQGGGLPHGRGGGAVDEEGAVGDQGDLRGEGGEAPPGGVQDARLHVLPDRRGAVRAAAGHGVPHDGLARARRAAERQQAGRRRRRDRLDHRGLRRVPHGEDAVLPHVRAAARRRRPPAAARRRPPAAAPRGRARV